MENIVEENKKAKIENLAAKKRNQEAALAIAAEN